MSCPICEADALESEVATKTHRAGTPFVQDGEMHEHFTVTTQSSCSLGHSWGRVSKLNCAVPGCQWNDEVIDERQSAGGAVDAETLARIQAEREGA